MTKQSSSPERRIMRLGSDRQEAAVRLLQAADVVRRRMSAAIEPYGVTIQQYNVLRILRGAGEPLPILAIAERMLEHTPGITRLLDRIEAKGLVARVRNAKDRRVYHCSITEAGLALLVSMDAAVDEVDEAAVGDLAPGEVSELLRMLKIVIKEKASE
jgi:DNA-binding MarR family transcriptional regulator